jgi:plastocyanin
MSPRTASWLVAAMCAAVLALPGTGRAATHTIRIEGMQYVPATLTVRRGDRVVWENRDVVPHTATAKGKFDSGHIASGRSWGHAIKKAGRYEYVCTFHPGMKASLVVQ